MDKQLLQLAYEDWQRQLPSYKENIITIKAKLRHYKD